jgi:hypothetical protein
MVPKNLNKFKKTLIDKREVIQKQANRKNSKSSLIKK